MTVLGPAAHIEQHSDGVFARILEAIATHVRRITYMPDLTSTLYYCDSWCTYIPLVSSNGVLNVSVNRSCYRNTFGGSRTHQTNANIMLLSCT